MTASLPLTAATGLTATERHNLETHLFHIPSMHCAGCIGKIERHLKAMPGVAMARVNLSRKEVKILSVRGLATGTLVEALAKIGFPAEEIDIGQMPSDDAASAGQMLKRLAVAGFGMMNVMLLSVAVWAGADATTRQFLHLISALVSLPILIYAAQPFLANAWQALRIARLNMDVPISLAIILAALTSFYEAVDGNGHAYFDAALSLTFFLLAGRYLDLKSRQKARSAAAQLARMQNPTARRKLDDTITTINVASIAPGMILVVRPGERIPVDGIVKKGMAESDRSVLTGESLPLTLVPGTAVFAGEICLNGVIEIEASTVAEESFLGRFIELVDIAERGRDHYSTLADRAAAVYAPLVHALAVIAFGLWWWLSGDSYLALTIAIAVLIITCPCALGLAVPAVMTTASGRLFGRGVLLKNATALERIASIDTVVFDKTGTLTTGRFTPASLDGLRDDERAVLAAMAAASQHPLARAIVAAMPADGGAAIALAAIREVPGSGVTARHNGHVVKVGKAGWINAATDKGSGHRRLGFRYGKRPIRWLDFDEEVSADITAMLAQLDRRGVKRILLTGDLGSAAADMAGRLGFDDFRAEMTPAEKLAFVKALQDRGRHVLMVGDGLNDTGAMAAADASVAPATALDAVRATADVVLLGGKLQALPVLLDSAQTAKRRILQNFAAAALYNMVAVPLAFAGLVTPLLAAVAMSASSITVVLNAVRPGFAEDTTANKDR